MSKNLRKCMKNMHLVCDANCPKIKKSLLKEMSKNGHYFEALFEIVHNINLKNIKLKTAEKKKLKKFVRFMMMVLDKPKSKIKRSSLVNQSGGFLPVVLPILGTVLAEILGNAIR